MTVPVKILSVLTGLSLAGSVQARIWTNDRGATVVAVLVAVRDAEVDLKLQDGRIVAVPKNVFSGADQAYILEWVKSGGTLPDTDVGAENPPAQGASGGRYVPLEPNWDAPWPERAAAPGYLLVKAVQETDELSVYETDHFVIESPGKLPETEHMALARRFETILSALAAVPMNLAVARRPSRKYLVRVCFQEEDFNKAPGLRNGRLKFSPTSFTALLLRDKKGKPLKLDAVDPRFAVTHWVAQSMDLEHWLVDGFSAYMAFLPMEKEAMVFRKLPGRLAAMLPRAVRTGAAACPGGPAGAGFRSFRRRPWPPFKGGRVPVLGRSVMDGVLVPSGRGRQGGTPQALPGSLGCGGRQRGARRSAGREGSGRGGEGNGRSLEKTGREAEVFTVRPFRCGREKGGGEMTEGGVEKPPVSGKSGAHRVRWCR